MEQKEEIKIKDILFRNNKIICRWKSDTNFGELILQKVETENGMKFLVETDTLGEEFYEEMLDKMVNYFNKNSVIIE